MTTIVHETAHQWFGDSLSPSTWRDIWLNEGFATYAEWRYQERTGGLPTDQPELKFQTNYAKPASDPLWTYAPGDPGAAHLFDQATYTRGAMALQALRQITGDGPFFALLRAWAQEQKGGSVSTQDLIALGERITGRSLQDFFRVWIYTPGKPTAWSAPQSTPAAVLPDLGSPALAAVAGLALLVVTTALRRRGAPAS